ATLRPMLSPMLWTSIATGKFADKHGILGFLEPSADKSRALPVGSTTRTTKALWNILSQSGLRTHAIGWFASHPAEKLSGVCVSDQYWIAPRSASADPSSWAVPAGAVHPPELRGPISALRIHPAAVGPSDLLPFLP